MAKSRKAWLADKLFEYEALWQVSISIRLFRTNFRLTACVAIPKVSTTSPIMFSDEDRWGIILTLSLLTSENVLRSSASHLFELNLSINAFEMNWWFCDFGESFRWPKLDRKSRKKCQIIAWVEVIPTPSLWKGFYQPKMFCFFDGKFCVEEAKTFS